MDATRANPGHFQTLDTLHLLTDLWLRLADSQAGRQDTDGAAKLLQSAASTSARAWALSHAHLARLEARLAVAYADQDEQRVVELETAIGALTMKLAEWPQVPSAWGADEAGAATLEMGVPA